MIKLLVLFLAATLVAVTETLAQVDETETLLKIPIQECKAALNVNENDAKILQVLDRMPENEVQSCLLECFVGKVGMVKNGKVDHEVFMKISKLRFGENFVRAKQNEIEQVFLKCQQEVEKRSNEKCGNGIAMRSCTIMN